MTSQDLLQIRHWLKVAFEVSKSSPHPTVKVGAALVDSEGKKIAVSANKFADGVNPDPERLKDGNKSNWIECAEALTIASAAAQGRKTKGARMYVTLEPCTRCAGQIAAAGIAEVVVSDRPHPPLLKDKWRKAIEVGRSKLHEAGVTLIRIGLGS